MQLHAKQYLPAPGNKRSPAQIRLVRCLCRCFFLLFFWVTVGVLPSEDEHLPCNSKKKKKKHACYMAMQHLESAKEGAILACATTSNHDTDFAAIQSSKSKGCDLPSGPVGWGLYHC